MHLKSLELRGFKSFARGIEIVFRPGINVIVGPNGCGKSNIADGIRWVLGEGNIRNLRGLRGEDVIFTGTDEKRPLGMATVSMTLDNGDRQINSDYSEINVTRRIYRSGDSEFLINLNEVRLKDIHNLFAGTGLGKKGYSIIGQGELEQVLDAKPFDRRLIIEEAAGLTSYRQRKDEAKAKLQASAQDLIRLEDILGEVVRQRATLEEKARKAQAYVELDRERESLEKKVLAYDLYVFSREIKDREREFLSLNDQLQIALGEQSEDENAARESAKQMMALREETTAVTDKKFKLTNRFNQHENETRLAQERVEHCRERLDQLETDTEKYGLNMDKLTKDLTISARELTVKETELGEKGQEAAAILQDIQALEQRLNQADHNMEGLKTSLLDLLREESSYKNQIREKEERLKRNREKVELGRTANQYRRGKILAWQEDLSTLESGQSHAEAAMRNLHQEEKQLETERRQAGAGLAGLEKKTASLQSRIRELDQQLLTLENSINTHVGFSEGVRRLLAAIKNNRQLVPGFLGIMTDLIEVPPGLEAAVEAAAGRSLENVVVRDQEDARAAIQLLKSQAWGRATFLPLRMLRNQPVERRQLDLIKGMPGVLGLAANLVDFSPDYRQAVQHVLGRVLVVEDLDTGLLVFHRNFRHRIVTVEGDIINPTGAMTGGKQSGRTPPLQTKAMYRDKGKQLKVLQQQLKETLEAFDGLRLRTRELDAQLDQLRQKISERAFQQEMQSKESKRIRLDLEQEQREADQFQVEEAIINREIATLQDELGGLTTGLASVQLKLAETEKKAEDLRQDLQRFGRQLDLLRERHTHCCDVLSLGRQELDGRRQGMEQLLAVKKSYEGTLKDYREQVSRFTKTIELEGIRIKSLGEEKRGIGQKLQEVEARLQGIIQSTGGVQNRSVELQQRMATNRQRVILLEERIKHLEVRKARIETEEKNALLFWEERYTGLSYSEFWEGMDNRRQREMRDICEALRVRIGDLGPVDVGAIEELDEVNRRFEFLQAQLADVQQARQSLTGVIGETEALMNSRYRDFLAVAKASFQRTFKGIFEGGEAELLQEGGEDNWQSGVEIIVKMPGKRRQSLNLLSGGERALTCIAFIFSLLVLKPTPFCLFDEVDSALDDSNLGRFTDFLKGLADCMQFIVITHRQGTIEAADNIFGVTMPERGMSEVYTLTAAQAGSLVG